MKLENMKTSERIEVEVYPVAEKTSLPETVSYTMDVQAPQNPSPVADLLFILSMFAGAILLALLFKSKT